MMNQETIGGYWPTYEDGTPVRIGDTVQGVVVPMEVKGVEVYAMATRVVGDCDCLHLEPGDRVKRVGDAPAGVLCLCNDDGVVETRHIAKDRQTWHVVIDGVRYGVGFNARGVIAEALDLCTSKKVLPEGATAVPEGVEWPTFEDGTPVAYGDHILHEGRSERVQAIYFYRPGHTILSLTGVDHEMMHHLHGNERVERPDSLERVATDARKDFLDYWSCRDTCCADCPAEVGGEYPYQRYDTDDCESAMAADVVARIRTIAGAS